MPIDFLCLNRYLVKANVFRRLDNRSPLVYITILSPNGGKRVLLFLSDLIA